MTSYTVTQARKNLYRLVDDVQESHEPVSISGRRNTAVLISEEDWLAIQETLFLQSIPGMADSIAKGMQTPPDKCSEKPGW
jgi:prevent-host-death family protein